MTDDEIMRQLSQAVRNDDPFAAEEIVTAGKEQYPEWDWPFLATVLWTQRSQIQEELEPHRQPAWRRRLAAAGRAFAAYGTSRTPYIHAASVSRRIGPVVHEEHRHH